MTNTRCKNPLLEAALDYSRRGWPVVALHSIRNGGCTCGKGKDCGTPGKHPRHHAELLPYGPNSATTDEQVIAAWWSLWPEANVGIATGRASFDALDVDVKPELDGNETLKDLCREHGDFPDTPEQITGSGGRQIFFKPSGKLRNEVRFAPGLDIRTDGGLVVAPPSMHISGGQYEWEASSHPDDVDFAEMPQWLVEMTSRSGTESNDGSNSPPKTGEEQLRSLRDQCKFIDDACEKGGNIAEPLWYAMLSNVASIRPGGPDLCHQYSKSHPKYSRPETEAKIRHALNDTGPHTCAFIQRNGFDDCGDGCRVKAPVTLLRVKPDRQRDAGPEGFYENSDGVYFQVERKDEEPELEWVCSPLEVRAMTRDSSGEEWGRLLAVTDPDGVVHLWAMPMSMTAGSGDEYRSQLKSLGLRMAPGRRGKERLDLYLNSVRPTKRARCVSRIGWHGRQFVLPDAVYGEHEGEEILLQGATRENTFQVAGTLDGWKENVGIYLPGNPRLIFAVSVAFAASLLELVGMESGGFHYVGSSSIGKTTVLQTAGSVCGGGGLLGYIRQWRTTDNALESIAASHCDSLMCLDEISQVDARAAGEIAYMLGNGSGKSRANRRGLNRRPLEWRLLFVSTGEITLGDKITEDGRRKPTAGQSVRVVDIPADADAGYGVFENLHGFTNGDSFARHLKEATARYYGTPLRIFLQAITERRDRIIDMVNGFCRDFEEQHTPKSASGQVSRVCRRFALVAAAGEIASRLKILPLEVGEAQKAAAKLLEAWIAQRGGIGAAEIESGIEQVRAFFSAHGLSRFQLWDSTEKESRVANRVGFRKRNALGNYEYYVFPDAYKKELCAGHNPSTIAKELISRGFLIPGNDKKASVPVKVPGFVKTRMYHLSPLILQEEN